MIRIHKGFNPQSFCNLGLGFGIRACLEVSQSRLSFSWGVGMLYNWGSHVMPQVFGIRFAYGLGFT